MTDERRHFTRVSFVSGAQLAYAGTSLAAQVLDLSFKGALVDVPHAEGLSVGSPCILSIPLGPGNAAEAITMSCEVAHIEGDHLGLLSRSIDLDSITHLRHLIELNLGDATLLDREFKALIAR
jgi:hypothetical protein